MSAVTGRYAILNATNRSNASRFAPDQDMARNTYFRDGAAIASFITYLD